MVKRILSSSFVRTWFLVLVLIVGTLIARVYFFAGSSPTLKEVLSNNYGRGSSDLLVFIATLLALSLATMSMAKGYEIFSRKKKVEHSQLQRQVEELSGRVNQKDLERLMRKYESLMLDNKELRNRLKGLKTGLNEVKKDKQLLKRNIINLRMKNKMKARIRKASKKRKAKKRK